MSTDEEFVHNLLRNLDHPLPPRDVRSLLVPARRRRWLSLGQAAGILLAVGMVGTAWAASGSGLRATLHTWITNVERAPDSTASATHVPLTEHRSPERPAPVGHITGLTVSPGNRLVIAFSTAQMYGHLHVTLTDAVDVTVQSDDSLATFTSGNGRLTVRSTSSRSIFDVQIPRTAPHVELRAADQVLFVKSASRISAAVNSQRGDTYDIPLVPHSPNKP